MNCSCGTGIPPQRPGPTVHIRGEFSRIHIPTARISFESVVRVLIEDVGARPARPDWGTTRDNWKACP
jgi:hypothetical protein